MALILGDVRSDFGHFPHLMPQRLSVSAGECVLASPTCGGFEWNDIVAVLGRDEWAFVLGVTGLFTAFLL